ncbi:MAG: hypothetical protein QOD76_1083, partial [Solirubrobacteraceae bacterium]|nr:hypothetical protein [Solirubrobacteraceae bacterium]
DRLIDAFEALSGGVGWKLLDEALANGPAALADAPPELDALLTPILEPPAWVDFELADSGAVAWWRAGALTQLVALVSGSLAFGYQSAGFARPLAATGRLTQMAPRRLAETARWVVVATRPGAMRPGGDGIAATVRLRLVHTLVRSHLRRSGEWNAAEWGEPISIGDTIAVGIGGFFIVPLRALRDLGVRYTPAELDAIFHLWRWICFVLGVPDRYLPASYAESEELMEVAFALDGGPNDDSAKLVHALLFRGLAYERFLPRPLAAVARTATGHAFGGLARRWMGREMADRLDVPHTPLVHLPLLLRPLHRARDAARATGLLGSEERIADFELALVQRAMELVRAAPAAIQPEAVQHEPALAA